MHIARYSRPSHIRTPINRRPGLSEDKIVSVLVMIVTFKKIKEARPAALIPATAIILRGVKCNNIHKCIADYVKGTLYGVVDLGRKKFAKVIVMPYGLQGDPGEAMSSLHTSKAIAV